MGILVCLPNPEAGNWQLLFFLAADLNQVPAAFWVPATLTSAAWPRKLRFQKS